MRHYKYIHIFWHDDLKFSTRIVQMINDQSNGFTVADHLFVTPYLRVYNALKDHENVVYYQTSDPRSADIVNKFAPYADWIFLNSLSDWLNTLRIKRKYQPRIIWRTWGHELRFADKEGALIGNAVKRVVRFLLRQEINRFYAVGISNVVDKLDIADRFGNVRTIRYPYPVHIANGISISELATERRDTSEPYSVMVGHSGHPVDNHIEILKRLERYRDENIRIFLPFSYGNKEYMDDVRKYAAASWGDKAVIIDSFLEYPEYLRLCAEMDAVILDGIQSYALGNLIIFLSLRKKIYVNRNGLLHRALEAEHISHSCTDEIEDMAFSAFVLDPIYDEDALQKTSMKIRDYEEDIDQWKRILAELSGEPLPESR